jgi:hypothetical protein
MHVDGMVLDFWMIYPENDSGWGGRGAHSNTRKDYFNLRIASHSATAVRDKYEALYQKELTQYYEIAPDEKILAKINNNKSYAVPLKMWAHGTDHIILEYNSKSEQCNFNGIMYETFDRAGYCVGNTLSRSLKNQLVISSRSRSGHQGKAIENFNNGTRKKAIGQRLTNIATELGDMGENAVSTELKKYINANFKQTWKIS